MEVTRGLREPETLLMKDISKESLIPSTSTEAIDRTQPPALRTTQSALSLHQAPATASPALALLPTKVKVATRNAYMLSCILQGRSGHRDHSLGVSGHFFFQRIFPTQGLNPGLLNCRQTLYQLSHQGRPQICSQLGESMDMINSSKNSNRNTISVTIF